LAVGFVGAAFEAALDPALRLEAFGGSGGWPVDGGGETVT
jgi:hypothetical protein